MNTNITVCTWSMLATMLLGVISFLIQSKSAVAQSFDAQTLAQDQNRLVRETLCPEASIDFDGLFDTELQRMEPAKIFDDLYLLGLKTVVAWALVTSEGIVLFEAMSDHNVRGTVIDHLIELGLDPADIKYVIISHAHAHHFSGATYLQDTYGARIVMSREDWDFMRSSARQLRGIPPPAFPHDDIVASDGGTITLGDTTITLFDTPGHTPGTLSSVFPVHDGEQVHYVGYLGGSGVRSLSPESLLKYMRSIDRFARIDDRVDVPLTNHPMVDGTLMRLDALAQRRPNDPHAFVQGNAQFKQWLSTIHECAGEVFRQRLGD